MAGTHFKKIDRILARYGREVDQLLPILQEIQGAYGHIPKDYLRYVAENMGITPVKAYSVVIFHPELSLEPQAKYAIKVCDGSTCHGHGAPAILAALETALGLGPDKRSTDDGRFALETVSCLGACGQAPAITVNGQLHPAMTPEKALALLQSLQADDL